MLLGLLGGIGGTGIITTITLFSFFITRSGPTLHTTLSGVTTSYRDRIALCLLRAHRL